MNTLHKVLAIGAMAFSLMLAAPHKSMAQDDGYVSDQEFYDELQQYGTWVQDDTYGDVWIPDVDGDFRPYATNGYWAQTDYGTTWVSDYPWGWATFHYGRWRYDDYYGWEWIPGHVWGPAWVSWRQGGGYYGWAPLGPGVGVTLSFGSSYTVPDDYWVCVPQAYITNPRIYNYYVPHSRIMGIIRGSAFMRNSYVHNKRAYITGPRPVDIQKITHHKVTVYKINNATKPGAFNIQKNTLNVYRPRVRKSTDARPVRVINATAYRQQNPNAGIGQKGVKAYNHGNAAKLAIVARSTNPNTTVVHVNPVNAKPVVPTGGHHAVTPAGNKPAAPVTQPAPATGNGKGRHQHTPTPGVANPATPVTQPVQQQSDNNPAQPAPAAGGKGHHQHTPVANPAAPVTQPVQQQGGNNPAQPVTPVATGSRGHRQHTPAPAVVPAEQHNTDQAAQQQVREPAQQAKAQEQQQKQQAAQQAREQAQQQKQQAAQQAREQEQQQKQQAAQQAREQEQQQKQQAAQQAREQAQQQKQQAAQQAREQAQQARQQQAQQQKLQQQQAKQQAAEQARQQKQQEAAQRKKDAQTPPQN